MTYIYDVLLNFTDQNHIIEFFEWQDKDILEHIKKILLLRITPKQMDDITNYKIEVSQELLAKIKNKTQLYKREKTLKYSALFTDLNKIIALEFNEEGEVIARSGLLLDEEDDIISECSDLKEEEFTYTKKEKLSPKLFLTRNELFKRKYLIAEINSIYESKNLDKLSYLYQELYGKDNLNIEAKYKKILTELEENYSSIHNNLYDIVRLTYTKNII